MAPNKADLLQAEAKLAEVQAVLEQFRLRSDEDCSGDGVSEGVSEDAQELCAELEQLSPDELKLLEITLTLAEKCSQAKNGHPPDLRPYLEQLSLEELDTLEQILLQVERSRRAQAQGVRTILAQMQEMIQNSEGTFQRSLDVS